MLLYTVSQNKTPTLSVTQKLGWNWGGVPFSAENLQYLKWGKMGPRLLLMTNRNLHTCFLLVPKSMTLDDWPLRTLFQIKIHVLSEPTMNI